MIRRVATLLLICSELALLLGIDAAAAAEAQVSGVTRGCKTERERRGLRGSVRSIRTEIADLTRQGDKSV